MTIVTRRSLPVFIVLGIAVFTAIAMLATYTLGMHTMPPIEYVRTLPNQVAIGWLAGAVGGLFLLSTKEAVLLAGYLGGYLPAFCAIGYLGWGIYNNFL